MIPPIRAAVISKPLWPRPAVSLEVTYTTPIQNHNSMEPHSTLACGRAKKLNLYDSTQFISGDRQTVATVLGVPVENVRVQCPYTGGGIWQQGYHMVARNSRGHGREGVGKTG